MFDNFKDYMFYLLPAVLKRHRQQNQFYIFCEVIGSVFDNIKQDILRVRREASIQSCSDCMLEVAGQDRLMVRLSGETAEDYRRRLMYKAIIAAQAGTRIGLLYAIQAVGYTDCEIVPLYETNPEKWAEININFYTASVDEENTIDFVAIKSEVMKTKQASTLPHYNFYYPTGVTTKEIVTAQTIHRYVSRMFAGILYLDGSALMDGIYLLGGEFSPLTMHITNRASVQTSEDTSAIVQIQKNLYFLDGNTLLDGKRLLNAAAWEEIL